MADASPASSPKRLVSLDAYRGFVMVLMASGGLSVHRTFEQHREEILAQVDGAFAPWWQRGWEFLSYQLSHVAWTGCALWDLIQPSFMFMVGVAIPFSFARRSTEQSYPRMLGHAMARSVILVLLAVFLSSNWDRQTNWIFTNVLAQIGLGYTFVFLLCRRAFWQQLLAAAVVLAGYWLFFYQYTIPQSEAELVRQYVVEEQEKDPAEEFDQFEGIAAHWNKHTNAAAAFDRRFLSQFPRKDAEWNGRTYWVNAGGYQTLNFVPSMATMIFGLMAGQLLFGPRSEGQKFWRLMLAGLACFAVSMSIDTTIWPVKIAGCDWSLCPVVKRIWSPSWAVFSAGWSFWMLAGFYWVIDMRGWRKWSVPLAVVGMNSIAMYVMSQLLKPWVADSLRTHICRQMFDGVYGDIVKSASVLAVLWLICIWLYRQRIFVRI